MKPLLITISIGLLLLIFVGALFVWGPLKRFLPQRVQDSVQKAIPDVFKANRIGSFFGGNKGEDERPVEDPNVPLGWQLKGQNGVIVVVTPFAPLDTTNATSSGTDGPKLPPIGDGTPPSSDFVLAGSAAAGDAYVIS